MFPDARFVHIVRDPYVVFPSTVNLWTSLGRKHGLQTPRDQHRIREKVFTEFRTIYDRLEEAKPLVPRGQFHELRYEELVKDTPGAMRRVYDALGLGGHERFEPRLREYLAATKGYEANKYTLSEADRVEVSQRWGDVVRRYGYDTHS
jgi:hypothetical protein